MIDPQSSERSGDPGVETTPPLTGPPEVTTGDSREQSGGSAEKAVSTVVSALERFAAIAEKGSGNLLVALGAVLILLVLGIQFNNGRGDTGVLATGEFMFAVGAGTVLMVGGALNRVLVFTREQAFLRDLAKSGVEAETARLQAAAEAERARAYAQRMQLIAAEKDADARATLAQNLSQEISRG